MGVAEFLKWFFYVDFKDWTNYVGLVIAIILLWWGIRTIVASLTVATIVS